MISVMMADRSKISFCGPVQNRLMIAGRDRSKVRGTLTRKDRSKVQWECSNCDSATSRRRAAFPQRGDHNAADDDPVIVDEPWFEQGPV